MVLYIDEFASQPPVSGNGRRTNGALMGERSLETSRQAISRLHHGIDQVLSPLVPGKKCALLDFPNYPNVGDRAIWVGEQIFLSKLGVKTAYFCPTENRDWNAMESAIGPDETIIITGRGNFGSCRKLFISAIGMKRNGPQQNCRWPLRPWGGKSRKARDDIGAQKNADCS
jgi:hypothetical protein